MEKTNFYYYIVIMSEIKKVQTGINNISDEWFRAI